VTAIRIATAFNAHLHAMLLPAREEKEKEGRKERKKERKKKIMLQ